MKRKIIFITCLSLCLTSFQFVNGQSVFAAEVCQGPAAYPPDLPGCLDPVVAAEQAAAAKFWVTELQNRVVDKCLQLHGGYGYMLEYPIARAWADSRIQTIYGGTTEIMKEIVGRSLTK